MKKKIVSLLLPLLALATFNAQANEAVNSTAGTAGALVYTSASPAVFVYCLAKYPSGTSEPNCVFSMPISVSATTTSVLLLKEIKAAQPDALNYIAGSAPSPALYSAVEKLQKFAAGEMDIEMTFDEAVNDIISNI